MFWRMFLYKKKTSSNNEEKNECILLSCLIHTSLFPFLITSILPIPVFSSTLPFSFKSKTKSQGWKLLLSSICHSNEFSCQKAQKAKGVTGSPSATFPPDLITIPSTSHFPPFLSTSPLSLNLPLPLSVSLHSSPFLSPSSPTAFFLPSPSVFYNIPLASLPLFLKLSQVIVNLGVLASSVALCDANSDEITPVALVI